jgi:PIN domain nuclease of toxin-antitoxin system
VKLLLDTHVLVWLLSSPEKLSEQVHTQIQQAADEDGLLVSAITPWEIAMLVAKGRLRLTRDVGEWVDAALALPGIHLAALSPTISVASTRLPWEVHSDPADRMLLATARHLGIPLVTADERMLGYGEMGFVRCLTIR